VDFFNKEKQMILLNDQVFRSQQEQKLHLSCKTFDRWPTQFRTHCFERVFFRGKFDRSVKLISYIFQARSTRIMKLIQKAKLRLKIYKAQSNNNVGRKIHFLLTYLLTHSLHAAESFLGS
jgi:hypothetical protein